MMSGIFPIVLAIVLAAVVVPPASASEQKGIRNNDLVEIGAVRKYRKRMDQSVSREHRDKEPYAGYRTDIAGNRYFYYRVGGGSPFGPGKALRPPYPN